MSVTPLFRCGRCGATGKPVDVALREKVVATAYACDDCIEKTANELAMVRPVFDELLRRGVPRDTANAMMTTMLEHPSFRPEMLLC
jgi:hypothetical protein